MAVDDETCLPEPGPTIEANALIDRLVAADFADQPTCRGRALGGDLLIIPDKRHGLETLEDRPCYGRSSGFRDLDVGIGRSPLPRRIRRPNTWATDETKELDMSKASKSSASEHMQLEGYEGHFEDLAPIRSALRPTRPMLSSHRCLLVCPMTIASAPTWGM